MRTQRCTVLPMCCLNDGALYSETLSSTCVRERVAKERSVVVRRRTVREFVAKGGLPMISRMAAKASPGIFIDSSACQFGAGSILSEQIETHRRSTHHELLFCI
jgi:hypothetical protein